jgi:tetratricopeptide (TPR) repeat protein
MPARTCFHERVLFCRAGQEIKPRIIVNMRKCALVYFLVCMLAVPTYAANKMHACEISLGAFSPEKLDECIAKCTAAIKEDPRSSAAYVARGQCYGIKGVDEPALRPQAMADYNKAIELDPTIEGAYYLRALLYREDRNYDLAIADLRKSIALRQKPFWLEHVILAEVYFDAGRPAEGLPYAQKSLSLEPGSFNGLEARGRIFEKLGRRAEAISDFRAALKKAPNYAYEAKEGLKRLGVEP